MNEASSQVSPKRRSFSEEFKQDAVRLVTSEEYSFKAAAALNVSEQTLPHWHKRLRRELRRAELEREILKKATAYFAKESPRTRA